MSIKDAIRLAARINGLHPHGVGHAWVNPAPGAGESTVSVRNRHGIESEFVVMPTSPADLIVFLDDAARTACPLTFNPWRQEA